MTPQQAATLEAAIGPLSQPAPNDVTGERDLRPAEQRRAEALAAVCGRVAGEDAAAKSTPGGASTTLHVGIDMDDLLAHFPEADSTPTPTPTLTTDAGRSTPRHRLRHAGSWFGVWAGDGVAGAGHDAVAGDRAPARVRRGHHPGRVRSDGELLDLGRAVRLFAKKQRRALWHRDKTCTYPGCDMPAGWVKIHHLIHWVDGGDSDLANAALLCQRHHTLVHDKRLIATVHAPDEHGRCVTWDLTPGLVRPGPARTPEPDPARARKEAGDGGATRGRTRPPRHRPTRLVGQRATRRRRRRMGRPMDPRSRSRTTTNQRCARRELDDALATMLDEERANTS